MTLILTTLLMFAQQAAPELAVRIAKGQDLSGAYRDRCIYQAALTVTRFKLRKNDWKEQVLAHRSSKAEVGPKENGEVVTRVISDTDDKGRPRKVRPDDQTILSSTLFLEALFFPFYPEKIKKYDLAETNRVEENGQQLIAIEFLPKNGVADAPLVEGTGYFVEDTGEIVKLEIRALRNFEVIDKSLTKLYELEATVEYAPGPEGRRLPKKATGRGKAKLKQLDGDFRFTYEETGHQRSPQYNR